MTPLAFTSVFELFAGPGGMSEGLKLAGIDPTLTMGFEVNQDACDTAMKAGHPRLLCDLTTISPKEAARQFGWPVGFHGSPPCPGFSPAGKGLARKDTEVILQAIERMDAGENPKVVLAWLDSVAKHEGSALCLEPLHWALELMPEWITMEQVATVLPLWEAVAAVLRKRGYSVWVGYMHAEQYGVPQTRKRAILLASRVKTITGPIAPTHSKFNRNGSLDPDMEKWVSMYEALGWGMTHRPYPTVAAGTASGGADPQMLGGSGARAMVRKEFDEGRWVEKGVGFPRRWDGGAGGVLVIDGEEYRARDLRSEHEPAFTITEKARSWGVYETEKLTGLKQDEKTLTRQALRVTVEDAGVLQSFSRDYHWQGSRTSQFQQIGNAVPPLMGYAMAASVL